MQNTKTMNKIIIILFCAALTLAACGGAATQNAGTDSASTNDGGSEQTTAPQDTIAKTIWEKLKTDDPHISRVVECGNEFEYNYYKDEQEKYFSKTSMDYKYHVPRGSEEPDNFINALYRLQCYPMSDGGWLAIVEQSVNGYALKKEDCGYKIFVVKYNDGNLSYPKNADYFPECFSFVEGKLETEFQRDRSHIQYSDNEIYYRTTSCWPLKFVWNGKKFETPSKFIFNAVSMYNGSFSSRYSNYASIGKKWEGSPNGIFREKSDSGKALAKLELQDQIIVGYTILDSLSGVVQDSNSDSITHSPIALGYPIKNVLEYKDNPKAWSHHMKDSTISKGMKDGKYVITQHLEHDTRDARRDIFIDFVAKDENSPIEAIKVYSSPFQVTIQDQVEKQKDISDEAKEVFKALNIKEDDYGVFSHIATDYKVQNGFSIYFKDDFKLHFHIYKTKDGRYLVMLVKFDVLSKEVGEKFWYYQNGTLTPTNFKIPDAQYLHEYIYMSFDDSSIEYDNGEPKPMDRIEEHYLWNGEEFESEIGEG